MCSYKSREFLSQSCWSKIRVTGLAVKYKAQAEVDLDFDLSRK